MTEKYIIVTNFYLNPYKFRSEHGTLASARLAMSKLRSDQKRGASIYKFVEISKE